MKLLVASASRHGATARIAERIAVELRRRGHEVDVSVAEAGRWLDDEHDGYIVGSAVYFGHWLRGARQFLDENAAVLRRHPVWLFSSGPTGSPGSAGVDERHVGALIAACSARSHAVFGGRLERAGLSLRERLAARAVTAPFGDFCDFDAVDAWTAEIDAALLHSTSTRPAGTTATESG